MTSPLKKTDTLQEVGRRQQVGAENDLDLDLRSRLSRVAATAQTARGSDRLAVAGAQRDILREVEQAVTGTRGLVRRASVERLNVELRTAGSAQRITRLLGEDIDPERGRLAARGLARRVIRQHDRLVAGGVPSRAALVKAIREVDTGITASTEVSHAWNLDRAYVRSDPAIELEWDATLDRRTCPRCAGLDGERRRDWGALKPPLHPRCRCQIVVVPAGSRTMVRPEAASPGRAPPRAKPLRREDLLARALRAEQRRRQPAIDARLAARAELDQRVERAAQDRRQWDERLRQRQRAERERVRQEAARQRAAARAEAEARAAAARAEAEARRQAEAARAEAARRQAEAAARARAEAEAVRQEAARRAEAEVARLRAEAEARAAAERAARQEAARQEAARERAAQEAARRQEAARQEAARREAARQEAARQEAIRQEAARREAARLEAARQEAARLEAARAKEAARQAREAAKQAEARAAKQARARAAQEAARQAEARAAKAAQEAARARSAQEAAKAAKPTPPWEDWDSRSISYGDEQLILKRFKKIFGRDLQSDDIETLLGVPRDLIRSGHVTVTDGELEIMCNLRGGGNISRGYKMTKDGVKIHHQLFELPKEARGAGLGKQVLRGQLDAYAAIGRPVTIVTEAAWDGQYVWPRMGFRLRKPQQIVKLKKELEKWAKAQGITVDTSAVATVNELATLESGGRKVGKDFLIHRGNEGEDLIELQLDLSNPEDLGRIRGYLGN